MGEWLVFFVFVIVVFFLGFPNWETNLLDVLSTRSSSSLKSKTWNRLLEEPGSKGRVMTRSECNSVSEDLWNWRKKRRKSAGEVFKRTRPKFEGGFQVGPMSPNPVSPISNRVCHLSFSLYDTVLFHGNCKFDWLGKHNVDV